MTLLEMKQKVLAMIEELNPDSEILTDDPDLSTKINGVINQVINELARMKKIPGYVEIEVEAGDLITFDDIEKKGGYAVYQIESIKGKYELKAQGTVIKATETGVLEISYFKYPEMITEKTKDKTYEFELSQDVLEIAAYGVAGDLLKSDVSAEYGSVYSTRYESMLQRLDPRYTLSNIYIEGGIFI